MIPYTGRKALEYDAKREGTGKWLWEQATVEELLPARARSVIDVPVGTGRFFALYASRGMSVTGVDLSNDMLVEARKKDPSVRLVQGDLLNLKPAEFDVAVCVRLLNWMPPLPMRTAIDRLLALATHTIMSVRTRPGESTAKGRLWCHSHGELWDTIALAGGEVDAIRQCGDRGYGMYRVKRCA